MSVLRRALRGGSEQRGLPPGTEWGSSTPPPPGEAFGTSSVYVSDRTVLSIIAAYACMSILADFLSTLPLNEYEDIGGGQLRQVDPSPVIAEPFAEGTLMDWLGQQMWAMQLRGNAYGMIVERTGRLAWPAQVMPVSPDRMQVRRLPTGEIQYRLGGEVLDPNDVLHMRGHTLPGAVEGMSTISYHARSYGLAIQAERFAAGVYQNASLPGGVLEGQPGVSEADLKATVESWKAAHQGPDKFGMPAATSGFKWVQTSLSLHDAMFIEARELGITEQTMLHRVPPHMIGAVDKTTSWGTGIEQQEMGFVRNTGIVWCRRFELGLSGLLVPGHVARFDLSHRLRGDSLQRAQRGLLMRTAGTISKNELRHDEDLPPVDGGDDLEAPLNGPAATSLAAVAATQPPAKPAPKPGDPAPAPDDQE